MFYPELKFKPKNTEPERSNKARVPLASYESASQSYVCFRTSEIY